MWVSGKDVEPVQTGDAKRQDLNKDITSTESKIEDLKDGQNLEQRYIPGFFPVDGLLMKLK